MKQTENDNDNPQQEILDLAKDPEEQTSDKFEDHAVTSNTSEEKNKLDTDIYNIMMVSPFLKQKPGRFGLKPISDAWIVGLFVFFVQIVIGSLIIVDIVMDGDSEGYNRKGFNPPLRVDPNVRAGQVFTLILALLMQNDVSSAIWNIYNLNFCRSREWVKVLFDDNSQGSEEENVELIANLEEEETPSIFTWILRILIPNILKLIQGLLVLFATWLVIVDSDNFVDLIKDFTALFVVSSIDEVFFILANHNFLSHDISLRAQAMDEIYISTNHVRCCSLSVTMLSFALLTYVIFGVIMFSCFAVVAKRQDEGDYIRERYPLCTENVEDISKLLDGVCHSQFNNRLCEYDLGDCREFNSKYPNCRVKDPWRVGDGKCDLLQGYNISACGYDGKDCLHLSCEEICNVSFEHRDTNLNRCLSLCKSNKPAKYPACKDSDLVSDGICSPEYNSPECGYDAGDCIHLNNEINCLSNEINRVYPECELMNKNVFRFKNGVCNDEFNSADCGFDGGDCSQAMGVDLREKYPLCTIDAVEKSKLGNGVCNHELNRRECGFDDGDCLLINELYPSCIIEGKDTSLLGNGICNVEFNYEVCGYDRGDCLQDFETFHAIYPLCELEGKDVSLLRNEECHEIFNNIACGYDNGACILNKSHCRQPDGQCQAQYNNLECAFDMGDCNEFNAKYPSCKVPEPFRVGDGKCDLLEGYNSDVCGFDGSDCKCHMLNDGTLFVSDTNLTHSFYHIQDRSAIYWSDENFLLFANHFTYQVNGEYVASMENSIIRWKEDSFTTPNSQSITYGWYENDSSCTKQKFDMLLSLSESGTWRMEEIGVFSSTYERKAFILGVNMYSGEEVMGSLNSCYVPQRLFDTPEQ